MLIVADLCDAERPQRGHGQYLTAPVTSITVGAMQGAVKSSSGNAELIDVTQENAHVRCCGSDDV